MLNFYDTRAYQLTQPFQNEGARLRLGDTISFVLEGDGSGGELIFGQSNKMWILAGGARDRLTYGSFPAFIVSGGTPDRLSAGRTSAFEVMGGPPQVSSTQHSIFEIEVI